MQTTSVVTKKRGRAAARQCDEFAPVLGEFVALDWLWRANSTPPLFLSEGAARWFYRNHSAKLAEANAVAIHAGRLLVHPKRFAAAAEAIALETANARAQARTGG